MKVFEIERQVASQHSAMHAFPSQGASIEQSYSAHNKIAALELQIESVKLLAGQRSKLEEITEALSALTQQARHDHQAAKHRERLEDQRYNQTIRLTRIAAWSSVIAAALTAIGVLAQIFVQ